MFHDVLLCPDSGDEFIRALRTTALYSRNVKVLTLCDVKWEKKLEAFGKAVIDRKRALFLLRKTHKSGAYQHWRPSVPGKPAGIDELVTSHSGSLMTHIKDHVNKEELRRWNNRFDRTIKPTLPRQPFEDYEEFVANHQHELSTLINEGIVESLTDTFFERLTDDDKGALIQQFSSFVQGLKKRPSVEHDDIQQLLTDCMNHSPPSLHHLIEFYIHQALTHMDASQAVKLPGEVANIHRDWEPLARKNSSRHYVAQRRRQRGWIDHP